MGALALKAYGATDVGRQRSRNEDCFFCDPKRGLFVVIDGVGGYAAGEIAAGLACDVVSRRLAQPEGTAAERLRVAIAEANNAIYEHSQASPEQHGMACVLTAVLIERGQVNVGHVGDTRLYEVRRDGIRKVTRDHSPVGLREDVGDLSEYEAMNHPRRSEILRDLGSAFHAPNDEHFIDIYQFEWVEDSALLLCSDGLTDLASKGAIHQIMLDQAGNPEKSVETLVELANEMGGTDNVTVVVVEGPAFRQPLPMEPAEQFAVPEAPEGAPATHPPATPPRRLRSRPAFFAYGWLVGCLLSVLPLVLVYQMLDRRLPEAEAEQQAARPPRTLHVTPEGSGAVRTVGAALDAARPGDVVSVAPGVYREDIRLKDSVAVISAIAGAAVLQSRGRDRGDSAVVAAQGVQGARLSGFKIDGQGAENVIGILLRDAAVEVVGVEVSGAGRAGVLVEGASEAVLQANLIVDNPGSGVYVRGAEARPRLVQNVISGNGTARQAAGVLIEGAARPVLRRNVITGNADEGIHLVDVDEAASAQFRQQNFFLVNGEGNAGRSIQRSMQ